MLRSLRIRDLAIIEDLSIEFEKGFNVLTGETGAGKSILVDAVGLAVGARADRGLVRSGTERATIEALFEVRPSSAPHAWAMEQGLADHGNGELLVRREIAADGNHRLRVNGSPCTLALLRELGGALLELHGQHEHQTLLSAERHLELLDRLGGHDGTLAEVGEAFVAVESARERLETLVEQAAARDARRERLQAIVDEIERAAPRPGELEELDAERSRLRNAGAIGELVDGIVAGLEEGEPAAVSLVARAARRARELATIDPAVADLAERLESASLELQDLGAAFVDYRGREEHDPDRLEVVEARRAELEHLRLRHGEDEEAVLETGRRAAEELERLAAIDTEIDAAREELAAAEHDYAIRARKLSRARAKAVKRVVPAVEAELKALALAKAQLGVDLAPSRGPEVGGENGSGVPLNRRGAERAEFLLAANPGEPLRPLAKVASGGELSRVMLALHAVFESAGQGRALVFDEVDTGISGKVADRVGQRLARIAVDQQVLCVTHLPQVAAYADAHYRVVKGVHRGRTRAAVEQLSATERAQELARMVGGSETTEAARRHATEMLAAAARKDRARPPRSA